MSGVDAAEGARGADTLSTAERIRLKAFRGSLRMGQWAAMPTAALRGLPDFLIMGGQRCGTTSLYRYLDQHPGALFPRLTKGSHWFDEEFQRSQRWYRSNFPLDAVRRRTAARVGHAVVVGEACPYYLYHPQIAGRIQAVMPDARLIAILRDPVERAWSGYHHERRRGYETLPFEAAIEAEPERLRGAESALAVPGSTHFSHQHHGYVSRGQYATQIQRLWHHVDADRTLVLYTDDLERDPGATMGRIHSFLGLPSVPGGESTDRRWNLQQTSAVPDAIARRIRAEFETSDAWLAANLEQPPPWRR